MVLFLIILMVIISFILLLIFGPVARTVLEIAIVIGGIIPFLIRRVPWLYLSLWKGVYAIKNTPATWDMTVQFDKISQPFCLETLSQELIQWGGNGSSLIAKTPNRVIIRLLRRFVLELYTPATPIDCEEGLEVLPGLAVTMTPITVGYRDSKHFLDTELLPLLEKIQRHLSAPSVTFAMRIDLPQKNPYYGLYIQRLRLDAIDDFTIKFLLPGLNKASRVTIAKDRLTIVSDTIEGFRLAVGAALAFKVPEVKSCQ